MRFAAEIARLVERALANLRLPASQIADQIRGDQVAPAASGSPGVVDLDQIPAAFVDLADAPASYAGQAGNVVAVAAGEDGLEFVAGGLGDPTTTAGDLIYRGPVALTRLGIGSAGDVLQAVGGGVPSWAAVAWSQIAGTPATFPPTTHTHPAGDLTDLPETVQDIVGAMVAAGANISVTYNAPAGTVTIAVTGALLTSNRSDAIPQALGSASAGSSNDVSRADHRHAMPTADDVGALPRNWAGPETLTGPSGTDGAIMLTIKSGSTTRTTLDNRGAQKWTIRSALSEAGTIEFTTPGGDVGFRLRDAAATELSDFARISGGWRWFAIPSGGGSNTEMARLADSHLWLGKTTGLSGTGDLDVAGVYGVDGIQVVSNRRTGWAAATGTRTRTTFATSTVTTAQLAERVAALIDDLIAHGLIGA